MNLSRTHHRFRPPRLRDRMNQRTPCASTGEFFNKIRHKRPFGVEIQLPLYAQKQAQLRNWRMSETCPKNGKGANICAHCELPIHNRQKVLLMRYLHWLALPGQIWLHSAKLLKVV